MLDWPYVEGLRLDEALHPLTLMAMGLYGKALPNQNGAPLRLVVPWKYGFKGIKSIVKITLTEQQPPTTWNLATRRRVRLLRQREPRGGSPALEPGHRAPHRRLRAAAPRCPSTATPSRWPLSTPAWTCAGTSEPMASPPLPWLKPAVLVGGLAPLALMLLQGLQGTLGPNVIEAVLNQTGLMCARLPRAVAGVHSAQADASGGPGPPAVRKLLGLLAFSYGVLHFLTYAVVDQGLALSAILEDITERGFIAVGFLALVLLVPLAVTSTNAAVRRMGFPALAAPAPARLRRGGARRGALRWRVKKDATEPLIYGAVLALLLGIRAVEAIRKRRRARTPHPA